MYKIKEGAVIDTLRPEIKDALPVMENVFSSRGVDMVVTAGTDGKHMTNSYHYKALAVDLRLASRLDSALSDEEVKNDLSDVLGPAYDVVLEGDHFHVEYDEKRALALGLFPVRA